MPPKVVIIPRKPDIQQDWSLMKIVKTWQPYSWESVFNSCMDEFESIDEILQEQEAEHGQYFPLKTNIFKAFELTPLKSVKVVIIGQDPYYQKLSNGLPRAQGLAFSAHRDDVIPESLNTIYRELERTNEDFIRPPHGDLTSWAKQGVLLLNACLTVQQGLPMSHGLLWIGFIKKVVEKISEVNPGAIYVMWGKEAQKMKKIICDKAPQLEGPHPASRSETNGFIGCNHFNKINAMLVSQKKTPIDWRLD